MRNLHNKLRRTNKQVYQTLYIETLNFRFVTTIPKYLNFVIDLCYRSLIVYINKPRENPFIDTRINPNGLLQTDKDISRIFSKIRIPNTTQIP